MLTESDPTEAPLTEADGLDILSALPTERAALISKLSAELFGTAALCFSIATAGKGRRAAGL